MWKTTDFPQAPKGYTWSLVLQVLLSKMSFPCLQYVFFFIDNSSTVLATATTQYLLWRDKKSLAKTGQNLAAIEPP